MGLSHIILDNMVWIPKAELSDTMKSDLIRKLTIYNRHNVDDVLYLYNDTRRDYFGVPLYYWKNPQSLAANVIDKRVEGYPAKFNMTSKPYPDQERVLTLFDKALEEGNTGIVVKAPPGWGKTRTSIECIQRIGKNAIVVVPKSDLVDQWVDRILGHTDLTEDDIGIFSGGKAKYTGKEKITVGLIHTLALQRFHQYAKDFGVICFDEVHMSVPPKTFAPVSQMYRAKYRLGVSATLDRDDGFDRAFHYGIEQVRIEGDATTNRMPATVYSVDYPKSSGVIPAYAMGDPIKVRATLISLFAKNRERTILLAKIAAKSLKSGRRVCVISDRTSILLDLHHILTTKMGFDSTDVGYFCSSLTSSEGVSIRTVSKAEGAKTLASAKIILSTYGLMSTGTDVKDLATIILATPQSKVTQTKGRVERVCNGKKSPVVVDIKDSFYEPAHLWFKKRLKEYAESNMVIKSFKHTAF